jgi:hypothetical protein
LLGGDHQYVGAEPAGSNLRPATHDVGTADPRDVGGFQYSSPWPWLLAIVISLAMWASLAWAVVFSLE